MHLFLLLLVAGIHAFVVKNLFFLQSYFRKKYLKYCLLTGFLHLQDKKCVPN